MPCQCAIGFEFCRKRVIVKAREWTDGRAPRGAADPRKIDSAAAVHCDACVVIEPLAAEKGIPCEGAVGIQFCCKGVVIATVGANRRAPRGVTDAGDVDVSGAVGGDAPTVVTSVSTE